jgi:16S rRNA (guanine527-N7)-methyltransferase
MKKYFAEFINDHFFSRRVELMEKFENYLELLREQNKKINLVSRETKEREFWTLHFLDSILPVTQMKLQGKRVLDFGTGGGMPGIPLKLVQPEMQLHLLDSRHKKMLAVGHILKKLDLKDCFTIVSRLEDLAEKYDSLFDIIVCRSVRIKPVFAKHLLRVLKPGGKLYLYKSKKLDDVYQFRDYTIIDVSHQQIGERKIVKIRKQG